MRLEWDEWKNQENIRKHSYDFNDAQQIFDSPVLSLLDTREDYGEDRYIGLGLLGVRVVVFVYTEPADDIRRIISLRKATTQERARYEQHLADELGDN